MPELIDEKTREELKHVLAKLPSRVKLIYFTQENECPACQQQRHILEETVVFKNKQGLQIYDFVNDVDEATRYAIDKIPATAVIGKKTTAYDSTVSPRVRAPRQRSVLITILLRINLLPERQYSIPGNSRDSEVKHVR